ncbi:MAG: DUF4345 family protein [Henriciella sp.]|nr:DUF4345 family protein [Hyphomonadaceae bacterium]
MPPFLDIIAILALGFCAALGLGSMLVPSWAAGVVRLVEDPDPDKPGGFSEFRATYGGLLLLIHLSVLIIMLQDQLDLTYKIFALFPVAMGWIGAGLGRTISLIMDKEKNRSNGLIPVWIPMEFALGFAILAPVFGLQS